MNFLRIARVAKTHPEDNSVDLIMVDDGSRFSAVQALALGATTRTGSANLPAVSTGYSLTANTGQDMLAVVGFLDPTVPVVLGFLFPQVNQVLFSDVNRKVERHASDVYTSIDGDGNVELFHPSGTYLRIGTDSAHEDLTGKDYDGNWKIDRNTEKRVHVHLSVRNGGSEVSRLSLSPDGDIEAQCDRDLQATVGRNATVAIAGNLTATVGGNASVAVSGNLTSSAAAWSHTGPVTISGPVTVHGAFAADGGGFTHNGVNVGSSHTHSGVTSGPSRTGGPG